MQPPRVTDRLLAYALRRRLTPLTRDVLLLISRKLSTLDKAMLLMATGFTIKLRQRLYKLALRSNTADRLNHLITMNCPIRPAIRKQVYRFLVTTSSLDDIKLFTNTYCREWNRMPELSRSLSIATTVGVLDDLVRCNKLDVVKWIIKRMPLDRNIHVLYQSTFVIKAIETRDAEHYSWALNYFGHVDLMTSVMSWIFDLPQPLTVLQWMHDAHYSSRMRSLYGHAVKTKDVNILWWAAENDITPELSLSDAQNLVNLAFSDGDFEVDLFLYGLAIHCQMTATNPIVEKFAALQDFRGLQWLYEHNGLKTSWLYEVAIKQQYTKVMLWALCREIPTSPLSDETFKACASHGDVPILQWMLQKGSKPTRTTLISICENAITKRQAEVIRWALAHDKMGDYYPSPMGFTVADVRFYLQTVPVNDARRLLFFDRLVTIADMHLDKHRELGDDFGGKLEICLMAGLGVKSDTLGLLAARKGQLIVLKMLHHYGCPLTLDMRRYARYANHHEVDDWLRDVAKIGVDTVLGQDMMGYF